MTDREGCSAGSARQALANLYPLMDSLEAFRGEKTILRISGLVGDAQDVGIANIEDTRKAIEAAVSVLESIRDDAQGQQETLAKQLRDHLQEMVDMVAPTVRSESRLSQGLSSALIRSRKLLAAQPPAAPVGKSNAGFFLNLTPEQQKAALEYDGPENFSDQTHPRSSADRAEVLAGLLARKWPETFTPYGNGNAPSAFAFNVANEILDHIRAAPQPTRGLTEISAERQRQIRAEGWSAEHDDSHISGELAMAGAVYALTSFLDTEHARHTAFTRYWPWDSRWFKPAGGRRDLVRAGALILAEIERLDRKSLALSRPHGGGK